MYIVAQSTTTKKLNVGQWHPKFSNPILSFENSKMTGLLNCFQTMNFHGALRIGTLEFACAMDSRIHF